MLSDQPSPLVEVPDDLLLRFLISKLNHVDLCTLSVTCKRFNALAVRHSIDPTAGDLTFSLIVENNSFLCPSLLNE